MKYLEKYTATEWELISYLPVAVGQLMGGVGSKRITGSFAEMRTSLDIIFKGKEQFPDNKLIQEIVPDRTNFKEFSEMFHHYFEIFLRTLTHHQINTTEKLLQIVLLDCEKALDILKIKEGFQQTIDEYKNWLLFIAFKVAHASKEGSFLGFGGQRFSKEEQRVYRKIELLLK